MAWTFLFIAGIFEVIFALGLKYTQVFSRLAPSVVTVVAGTASVVILSQSVKALRVGTAYPMWTGIGAIGAAVLGMWLFNEPRDVARLVCIGLIISGIVGLRLTSTAAEFSRQLARQGITVVIGARNETRGAEAAKRLRDEGLDAHYVRLDVTDASTIEPLPRFFEERFGRLDILVNNAGLLLDEGRPFSELDIEVLRQTFETNFFGVFAVTKALLPLIRRSEAGRIVNVSSQLGSLADISNPDSAYAGFVSFAYPASKVALNALTALLAKELRGSNVKVNSADPGWVQTDMGTAAAPLTPEEGADTPVWLATLPADGPSGGFFSSRQTMAW